MINQMSASSIEGYTAIISAITLFVICCLIFWLYRKYRVDLFREEMFVLRDSLFDEALAGLIEFNHPAYGMLRTIMNGYIRFGHRLSFWQFAYLKLALNHDASSKNRLSFNASWSRVTQELDETTKLRLNFYKERMNMAVIKHILFNVPESFLLVPIILFIAAIILIKDAAKSPHKMWWERIEPDMNDIENAALVYGS